MQASKQGYVGSLIRIVSLGFRVGCGRGVVVQLASYSRRCDSPCRAPGPSDPTVWVNAEHVSDKTDDLGFYLLVNKSLLSFDSQRFSA